VCSSDLGAAAFGDADLAGTGLALRLTLQTALVSRRLHPELLHGLIELEGPMEFRAGAGRLESAVTKAPNANAITDFLGNVPGSFLNVASLWADPFTFNNEPMLDWLESLASPKASRRYSRVRRWTLDEMPLPRRLFEEVVEQLYRDNRFAAGTLTIGQRKADPRALVAPVLAVCDPRSRIIPPLAMEAYRHRTGSTDVEILDYAGDVGVMLQHVGVLVGDNAHKSLWPRITEWMRRHSAPVQ